MLYSLKELLNYNKILRFNTSKYYFFQKEPVMEINIELIPIESKISEAELSNLHLHNITNGFLPLVMVNFNNGVPAPEERQTIEDLIQSKFTGTDNAGRFMVSFNDDPTTKPTIDRPREIQQ